MKRFLTSIALLSILINVSYAQTSDGPIDLEALIALPLEGSTLNQTGDLDVEQILCGIRCNTTDSILNTQSILFYSSFNNFPTSETVNASGFQFTDDILVPDSGIIFTFPNDNMLGAGHVDASILSADSIKALCNWDDWQNGTFTTINRADLVVGQAYGFFFKVQGIQFADAPVNEYREDPNFEAGSAATNGNNRTAVKVIWGQGTSIKDLLAKKDKANIEIYPNPSNNIINFNFDFAKPSHATAVVRDISGKVVMAKNYGRVLTGTQKYALNISSLSAGNYILQFDTDNETAVAKFTVTK